MGRGIIKWRNYKIKEERKTQGKKEKLSPLRTQ